MFTSTPVSTDSKILEHFDQMRTLISGFLQQKSDRQPFFDYVGNVWVIWNKHSLLIVFEIFGPEKDWLLVLKRTSYCSRSYILPSCQATAPSLLK